VEKQNREDDSHCDYFEEHINGKDQEHNNDDNTDIKGEMMKNKYLHNLS
jgi:hypothetical protein